MAVIIVALLSAALGGAYLFHCAGKKKLLGALGAGILMLIGLSAAVLMWVYAL